LEKTKKEVHIGTSARCKEKSQEPQRSQYGAVIRADVAIDQPVNSWGAAFMPGRLRGVRATRANPTTLCNGAIRAASRLQLHRDATGWLQAKRRN
jgi:hypothetical protein